MPNHPYLSRSGKRGFWRYRRSVPLHLRPLMGVREVLMSFNTTVLEETLIQYHFIAADTERRLDLAQAEWDWREEEKAAAAEGGGTIINHLIDDDGNIDLGHACASPEDLAAACEQHYQWCKNAEQAFRLQTTERVTADPEAFWRGEIIPLPMSQADFYALPEFAHMAGTGDGFKYLLAMAYAKRLEDGALRLRAILATQDVQAVAANLSSCRECAKRRGLALIEAELRLVQDFLTSTATFVPSPSVSPKSPGSVIACTSKPNSEPLLSAAVREWVRSGSQGNSAWSAERRALCQRVMDDFIELCDDKGIGSYRKSDGRVFVQLLRRLPANLEKKKSSLGLTGKNLGELADIAERRGLVPQDDNNTNKKVGIVHQCFSWIMKHYDECEVSPVQGMKIITRTNAKDERDPFTPEQLTAIFNAPIYMGCQSERNWSEPGELVLRSSAKFWVPLMRCSQACGPVKYVN